MSHNDIKDFIAYPAKLNTPGSTRIFDIDWQEIQAFQFAVMRHRFKEMRLQIHVPDLREYLPKLVLQNPADMNDLYDLSLDKIVDYLVELSNRMHLDKNPHIKQAYEVAVGAKYLEDWAPTKLVDGREMNVRAFGARTAHNIIAGNGSTIALQTIAYNAITREPSAFTRTH